MQQRRCILQVSSNRDPTSAWVPPEFFHRVGKNNINNIGQSWQGGGQFVTSAHICKHSSAAQLCEHFWSFMLV